MSSIERKTYLELEEKYKTVLWRRVYGCTASGELINGMVFIVDGTVVLTLWEK